MCRKSASPGSRPLAICRKGSAMPFAWWIFRAARWVLLYDVHRGKSHHRHLRGKEAGYKFVDEDGLLDDFLRDVALILEGKL
jgi:hypothetical protein